MISDWADRNLKLLPFLLLGGTLAVTVIGLTAAKQFEPPPPVEAERLSDTGTLLVVMQDGCGACTYFSENIAPAYRRSAAVAEAPLNYVDIYALGEQKTYTLAKGVYGTPTLLMIDRFGREVGRSVGSPRTPDDLAALMTRHSARMNRRGI